MQDISQASSRFELIHGTNLRDMVGRDHEIGLMGERWRQARENDGQGILLSGDAGIGKSRIVRALQENAFKENATSIILQCVSFQSNSPLQPFIEYFSVAANIDHGLAAADNIERLQRYLHNLGDDDAENIELFARLLNVEITTTQTRINEITPEQRMQRVHHLIIATVLRLSKHNCVLLVFEDAHWADASSIELMEKMIAAAESQALLVVITFRPEFKAPWSSFSHLSSLPLAKISRSSIKRVINNIAKGKELPDPVVDQIIQKTDGIPLFIEELTRMIMESDLLVEREVCYELLGDLKQLEIPSTLQASLLARLDRLQSARQIAQTAAAIGRQFDQQLLHFVMQIDVSKLQQALDQLIEAEMIFRSGSNDNQQYIFKHALIQDAAYESLLKSERQRIHRRIADVLEQQFQLRVENRPEVLAYHVTCAGQVERALPLWLKAAKVSMQKFFHVESRNHLDTGLTLLLENPHIEALSIWELRYQAMLGQVWWVVRGYASPEAGKAYARARELCRTVDIPELVGPVFAGLWMFLIVGGQHRQALAVSDEFMSSITNDHDGDEVASAHYTVAMSQYAIGSPQESKRHLLTSIAAANPDPTNLSIVQDYGGDLRVTAKSYITWIYLSLGEVELAEEGVEHAMWFSKQVNVPIFRTRSDWIISMYYTMKGDWVNAGIVAKRSLDEADRLSSTMTQGAASMIYFASQAITQNDPSYIDKMNEGLDTYELSGARFFTIQKLCHCAEVLLYFGRVEQATQLLRKAKGRVAEQGERYYEAEVHRFFGLAAEKSSAIPSMDAEKFYRRAQEVAKQQGTILFELRAVNDLAQLMLSCEDYKSANMLLLPYSHVFDSNPEFAEKTRFTQLLAMALQ